MGLRQKHMKHKEPEKGFNEPLKEGYEDKPVRLRLRAFAWGPKQAGKKCNTLCNMPGICLICPLDIEGSAPIPKLLAPTPINHVLPPPPLSDTPAMPTAPPALRCGAPAAARAAQRSTAPAPPPAQETHLGPQAAAAAAAAERVVSAAGGAAARAFLHCWVWLLCGGVGGSWRLTQMLGLAIEVEKLPVGGPPWCCFAWPVGRGITA
eukprot:1158556-Pelagomonas_calceolata.AAC.15